MHEGFVPKGLDESSLALQCRGEGAKEMSVPTGTIEKLSPVLHWLGFTGTSNHRFELSQPRMAPSSAAQSARTKVSKTVTKQPRACALIQLANLKAALGDLDHLERIISLNGYVNAIPWIHRVSPDHKRCLRSPGGAPRISRPARAGRDSRLGLAKECARRNSNGGYPARNSR